MNPNIFISYSRREVGFVDDLTDQLEKKDYKVWLDYRRLVPGKPWKEQIDRGIREADVILLVVSKSAIASENVEFEWRRVLEEKNKRIILLIFEAVDLPEELEQYEWVDFRGKYQDALKELDRQLQMPEQEEHPAPETGFRVPSIVWVAFALSLVVGVMSLGSAWTLFVPFFLVQLPFRILKRSFPYFFVQASLVMLPITLYLASLFSTNEDIGYLVLDLSMASIPFVIALIYVLRSPGMQRWGKPESIPPLVLSHHQKEYPTPKPLSFFVEHAPQDRAIADEMITTLKSNGHHEAEEVRSADSIFTLLSAFKTDSEADCQTHVVYPVILQSNKNISPQLSKVQWMDFRLGVRNIDAIGKLLNEPQELLKALCIRPMGAQLVLPRTIMILVYFITFLAVVCIGSWTPYILQYIPEIVGGGDLGGPIFQLSLSIVLFGVLAYFMGRQIVERKGPLASVPGLVAGMAGLGLIILWQSAIDQALLDILGIVTDVRGYSSYYPPALFIIGGAVMLIYLIINRRELMYWFPSRRAG